MVKWIKNGKVCTALCSRCKTAMVWGRGRFSPNVLKCPNCGWTCDPKPDIIVDEVE